MANIQVPALPAATELLDSDLLHIRQGASDKKLTGEQAKTFFQGLSEWLATTDYLVNSYIKGSDGEIYRSLVASGPNEGGAVNPVGDTSETWEIFVDKVDLKSGRKNYLINGSFGVWQRGGTFSGLTNGFSDYTADRWNVFKDGDGSTSITWNGLEYFRVETSGQTALGSLNTLIRQRIENPEMLFGKTLKISLDVQLTGGGNIDCRRLIRYPTEGNISLLGQIVVSGDRQKITFTDTLPTLPFDPSVGNFIEYGFFSGVLNEDLRIYNTQVEIGDYATDFEYRPIAEELALCQRYYQQHPSLYAYRTSNDDTIARYQVPRTVTMRAAPTETGTGTTGTLGFAGTTGEIDISVNGGAVGIGSIISNYTADAEL